jgi:hypothetical protein
VVATFHDSGLAGPLSSYSATIDWNESATPTTNLGQIVQLGDNDFQVLGSLPTGFPEEGTYMVYVTVSHNGTAVGGGTGPGGSFIATAKVADAPLSGAAIPIVATEGTPFTGPVATFTDLDPGGMPSDYTVTINWGDGTPIVTLPGSSVVSQPGGPGTPFIITVDGTGHVYNEEGTYTLTVSAKDNPAAFIASEQVTVNDTPPVAVNPQPTVTVTEGTQFILNVATFKEIYGTNAEPSSDFTATIDWGDGSPVTEGAIISTSTPGVYNVLGSKLYSDSGVNGGVGHFTINVTVNDDGGTHLSITNTANVSDVPITLTGRINEGDVVNESATVVVTNNAQPTFYGTLTANPEVDAAGGDVKVYATPVGGGPTVLVGATEAGSDGSWSITEQDKLPDGTYNIFAQASDAAGQTTTQTSILPGNNLGPLLIQTKGPKVVGVSFANRVLGELVVQFQDGAAGLDLASIQDAANYRLTKVGDPNKLFLVNVISQSLNPATGIDTVTLRINDGRQLRGGNYLFTILSGTGGLGIRDNAGNPLDGAFYGFFPSGNNVAGGSNFVAVLGAVHHTIFAPGTVVGHASPVVPPGTPATGTTIPTANPFLPSGNPNFTGNPSQLVGTSVRRHHVRIAQAVKKPKVTVTATDLALEEMAGGLVQ